MSILLSTVLPIALSGVALPAASAIAAPAPASRPVITQPARALPKPLPVKVTPPAAAPATKPQPGIVTAPQPLAQPPAELIQIQAPQAPKPAPQTAPTAADRSAIIGRVSKAFSDVKTAQGNFSQIDAQGGSSSGAFFISRPGKVRFDYSAPEEMHIVSDGTSVSIEEPKRKAWDSVPLSSTPLHLFLRSNVDLQRDGSVTDVRTQNGSHFVTLVDKTGEAEGKMILEFRASDFELLGWRAIDGSGAETRVRLTDTKKNVSLKPALFLVRDPNDLDRRR
ncbi:MAG TPA: outer membrane lipoprotein carrier protein LolA [Hyphomonadaceae bacterium]|nr:outer membrane lipoprotein carrier protein LolA [Hyphomonadaceae bacterium]